jgi:hypothetical protein
MDKLSVATPIEHWHSRILQHPSGNDFIFFSRDPSISIWFTTNYLQFLSRNGNCEVVPLYGKLIHDLETFIYQANFSLPVGYKLIADHHALYDLLLNFETEPLRRVIFWNDAGFLLKKDRKLFAEIFESLIMSAYLNRNGISTIKDDGTRYLVDQRNLFFVNVMELEDLIPLLDKEYYIPSIDDHPEQRYSKINFNIIELID